MNKYICNGLVAVVVATVMGGCGSSNGKGNSAESKTCGKAIVDDALKLPASKLSQELANTLSYMGNEESFHVMYIISFMQSEELNNLQKLRVNQKSNIYKQCKV